MKLKEINSLDYPGVEVFSGLTEAQLRNKKKPDEGLFIVESPKVINVALDAGYEPVSLLCEARHICGDAAGIIKRCGDIPVYTGSRGLLSLLTGYALTRGVLCAMKRKPTASVSEVVEGAKVIAVIDGVCDTTNIGAIFRSAVALGIDGVLLTGTSCDPLNRRAVRVSMGSVFLVKWGWLDGPVSSLHDYSFTTVALALKDRALSISDPVLKSTGRLAVILGTEGDGLSDSVVESADFVAKIPMFHNVDSLNVAAASAVAFWELRRRLE